ncbi:hypothetical protein DSO57_1007074 [Entomophthora muscae]|uniref:Uncharacterized protein n=1 Tax=Entomophthora muscae TaxID=34485 RepID=A0ACC2RYK2_9FUNG|nr:hypothetical protein DSO57_1007074 [Entomophthora muscae]
MTLFQASLCYASSFLPELQGYFCSQSAPKLATTIKETQTQLVAHLQSAILDYKRHYDKKRIPGNNIQPCDSGQPPELTHSASWLTECQIFVTIQ